MSKYFLTKAQLESLMQNTDEGIRMKILNEIMNDQFIEDHFFCNNCGLCKDCNDCSCEEYK